MPNDKPSVDFNIDTFTPEAHDPFALVLGGKRYEMTHMDDLDGFDFLEAVTKGEAASTLRLFEMALGRDELAAIRKAKLPKATLDELQKRYLTHCGIDLGNSGS